MPSSSSLVLATTSILLSFLALPTTASPFYSHMILDGAGNDLRQAALRAPSFVSSPPPRLATVGLGGANSMNHQDLKILSMVKEEDMRSVWFERCGSGSGREGEVKEVRMGPCVGGEGTKDQPCVVQDGENYTVEITFNTPRFLTDPVASPRSNVYASYDTPKELGPYPGQSFSACSYTSCPLGNDPSEDKVFTFPFQGFPQSLDKITFNVTSSISAPSIFCANIPVAWKALSGSSVLQLDDASSSFGQQQTRLPRKKSAPRRLPFGGLKPKAW